MDIDQIRGTLQSEGHRLNAMRAGIRDDAGLDPDSGISRELSMVDQHPADIGTEENQKAVDLSMIEQVEAELSDVESALRKLEEGIYGTCEACGESIDEARLEALPATRFCINDQAAAERSSVNGPRGEFRTMGVGPTAPI